MRPLRIVLRAVLLAAGCAVMLATPPPRPRMTAPLSTWLPAGAAQTVEFGAPCPGWERMQLYINPKGSPEGPRLVGFVSPTPPPAEALASLTPELDFAAGTQAGAMGPVAFVARETQWIFVGDGSAHPDVKGPGPLLLTVYSPDAALGPEFAIIPIRGCDTGDRAEARVLQHWPPVPDGGPVEGGGR